LKRLVYFESFDDIQTAIQREHNIKHWSRAWKVRLILASTGMICSKRFGQKAWMAGTSPAMTRGEDDTNRRLEACREVP
jgi:hypothetical protein